MTRRRRGGKRIRRVSTRVSDETLQDLQAIADAEDRKVSDVARILIERALDEPVVEPAPKADIRRQRGRR